MRTRFIFSLAFAALFALTAGAQNATRDASGNFRAIESKAAAPHDSTTTYTYTDAHGAVLPVYRGRKGGMYVIYHDPIKGTRRHYLKTEAPQKK